MNFIQITSSGGSWVVQSAEHPTLDLGSGYELPVRGFEPCVGLCSDSTEPAWHPLTPSLSAPLFSADACTLSKIKKKFM